MVDFVTLYQPEDIPTEIESLPLYIESELLRIANMLLIVAEGHLEKTFVVPERLYDGLTRYADGTNWDPGSGEGAYIYYNATWNRLG